jgi:hypothetical protein
MAMRPKGFLTSMVGLAAVAGLSIWLSVEHRARLRLGEEHQALEPQVDQMAELIARNEQLSNRLTQASRPQSLPDSQSREVLRLRGAVGVLRQQLTELETARAENRQARAALASGAGKAAASADYWPRDSWAFAGFASPDAALQSSLWAANQGNLKALVASTTGEVQKRIAADFEGKSDTEASIKAMDEVSSLKSVRILNREAQGDDTVVLTTEFEDRTGTHTGKMVMKKVGNEWKVSSLPQ